MSSVEDLLRTLLDVPGVTGAALVDAVTGLTYGQAGGETPDAEECSGLAVFVADRLHAAGARGELESIVVTGTRQQVVLHACPRRGDPLLLTAALEREQANLALVMHQLGRHAERAAG
ncbi:hypothetical protein V5N34_15730 [Streptomyces baarnensis]|uniref:hypothetical protein n=1 Tax=Streptomyces TaxID=1883 RepID=UPI0029B494F8|nr:hypothetical protein [Streptomyces sp. ME02-6979.5a]MDX3342646.1 hypothetical protein [Streptomyces sp. ME02-6979.5a]